MKAKTQGLKNEFIKWLMKKSTIGSTTRWVIKAYERKKESDPGVSDVEIYRAITKRLYNITGNCIDPVIIGTTTRPKTLREYLKCIAIYERLPDSIDSENMMGEVIDEICDESGIEESG